MKAVKFSSREHFKQFTLRVLFYHFLVHVIKTQCMLSKYFKLYFCFLIHP